MAKKTASEANLWLLAKKWDAYAKEREFESLDAFCTAFASRLEAEEKSTRQFTLREVIDVTFTIKDASAIVKAVLNKIPEDWWNRLANDITSEEWEDWLFFQGLKPTSWNDYRSVIHRAYEKALGRGRVVRNPMNGVDRRSTKDSITQVDPLTPEEAEALMRRCEEIDPEMAPAFALMLFAGVRPDFEDGEISRLRWEDIDWCKNIIAVRRKGQQEWERKVIKLSDQVAGWLARYRKTLGYVQPRVNTRRRREEILDGFREPGKRDDLTRKTFARFSLALYGQDATVAQMGHGGVSVLLRNYVTRATDEEAAKKFFSILPEPR